MRSRHMQVWSFLLPDPIDENPSALEEVGFSLIRNPASESGPPSHDSHRVSVTPLEGEQGGSYRYPSAFEVGGIC